MRDAGISEEDNDVVVDVALGNHRAEEADGVMDGMAFGHHDVAAELDRVFVGARRLGRDQKCRKQKESREQALSHGDPHSGILRVIGGGSSRELRGELQNAFLVGNSRQNRGKVVDFGRFCPVLEECLCFVSN